MQEISTQQIRDRSVTSLLGGLADDADPAGGGALAAVAAAAGAAMVSMVGRYTIDRSTSSAVAARMEEIVAETERARDELVRLADEDAAAFQRVVRALRSPQESAQEGAARHRAVQDAYRSAAEVPMVVARRAIRLMELALEVTGSGDQEAASEGVTGAAMLFASTVGAVASSAADAAALSDAEVAREIRDETRAMRERATLLLVATEAAFVGRLGSAG